MENNKLIAIAAIILILLGGVIYLNVTITSSEPSDSNIKESAVPTNKTDAEVILEGAEFAKETYDELRENKLRKDSAKKADRKQLWVYQIGLPITNEVRLLAAYNQLKGISNLKVFKGDKKRYFIYKEDGRSEQQLKDSLESFKAQLNGIEPRVEILDLMSLCDKNDMVVRGSDVKIKKEELGCFTCK